MSTVPAASVLSELMVPPHFTHPGVQNGLELQFLLFPTALWEPSQHRIGHTHWACSQLGVSQSLWAGTGNQAMTCSFPSSSAHAQPSHGRRVQALSSLCSGLAPSPC